MPITATANGDLQDLMEKGIFMPQMAEKERIVSSTCMGITTRKQNMTSADLYGGNR